MALMMDPSNEVIIYVEKFNKTANYILVDFADSNEFILFNQLAGLDYNWQQRPTMIEISNYSHRTLREGSYYSLSRKATLLISERIVIVENSLLIGFRLELNNKDPEIIGSSKSFNELDRFRRGMEEGDMQVPTLDYDLSGKNRVVVRDIGQGSWNEIYVNDHVKVIFDIGTIHTTRKPDLIRMIGGKDIEYQNCCPTLIVSHWDVDHYHFLLALHDNTIKVFAKIIYRGIIPNLTVRKLISRMRKLNKSALEPIAPLSPFPKRSSSILKSSYLSKDRQLLLFNSARNRSRNKCALGLGLRKRVISVIFPGDYDYSQVSGYMLPEFNYKSEHFLVVPHHGGNAGSFVYSYGRARLNCAVISVGKNPYGHPNMSNIIGLRKLGFTVIRTDYHGEFELLC